MPTQNIITIGASAGGLKSLMEILSELPAGFPASLFVVLHLAPQRTGELLAGLNRSSHLEVRWAEDQQPVQPGVVYMAPANRHMVLNNDGIHVLFGPRESGARPSIDVLFRSAAATHRSQVVGVILSGTLDDGARGLQAIQRCGGTTIMLDPRTVDGAAMPLRAIQEVEVDHCLAVHEIAPLLQELAARQVPRVEAVPDDVATENQAAQHALAGIAGAEAGESSSVACPDCGGDLRRYPDSHYARYRCHLGHAYSTQLLIDRQRDQLEQAIWIAARAIGDRQRMLDRLAEDYAKRGRPQMAKSMAEQSAELTQQANVLRAVLAQLSRAEPFVDVSDVADVGS